MKLKMWTIIKKDLDANNFPYNLLYSFCQKIKNKYFYIRENEIFEDNSDRGIVDYCFINPFFGCFLDADRYLREKSNKIDQDKYKIIECEINIYEQ